VTVPRPREEATDVENGQKLDTIQETVTEIRVSVGVLVSRHDAQDVVNGDVERRLRILERRSYGIPTLATVGVLVAIGVPIWHALAAR
jgi:hypothetical protein